MDKLKQIEKLRDKALAELKRVDSLEAAAAWRSAYLGRKGALTQLLRGLGRVPATERPRLGQLGNELKVDLEEAYAEILPNLKQAALRRSLEMERVDVTLPGRPLGPGRLHLSTQILREIYAIFAQMGFQVEETPEVELDEYNFTLLNIPPYHPARDMWSSFYTTDNRVLLRTHTSPGQIRVMRRYAPEPIRVMLPGKCYRYEQVTARSEIQFHQVEGLAVGRQISMADLKGVLIEFARQMFGEETRVRFRASHFPFTEPSAEMDIECFLCGGQGCRVCKHTGWLEILGSGMVHPQVLTNGGYDPQIFSGFAFGMGPERIAMLKYRIDDIRYFFISDLRFLEQF
ncbi:MAG: phenylalanine--tRNA ligase subunit alpha [Chloroflexi bacterium]|nr:phenylalanine--tRNA ligase subunit alpha [Chloroflexota bacterium]